MASFGCDSQEVSPISLITRQLAFANFNLTPKGKLNYCIEDDFPTPVSKEPRVKKIAKRIKSIKPRRFGTNLRNIPSAVYDECANLEPPCPIGRERSILPPSSVFPELCSSVSYSSSGFGESISESILKEHSVLNGSDVDSCEVILWGDSCSLESSAPDEGFVACDKTLILSDGEESVDSPERIPELTARPMFSERLAVTSPLCTESNDSSFVLRRRSSPVVADLVRQNSMAAEMGNDFIKRRQQLGLSTCYDHDEEEYCILAVNSSPESRGQSRRTQFDDNGKETQHQTTPKRRRPCFVSSGDTPIIPGGVLASSNRDISAKQTAYSPMQELFNVRKHSGKKNTRRTSGVSVLTRCLSASMALDENKVAKSIIARDHQKLSDDCQSGNVLPVIESEAGCRSREVHCISPQVTADLINGSYNDKIDGFTLIDCRYPYEYDGGHIKKAVNLYTHKQLLNTFLYPKERNSYHSSDTKPRVLVFHCEFSSQRAPTLAKFLRSFDRCFNIHRYPFLYFPEIYVMQGGYSEFFKSIPDLCVPNEYIKMFDDRYKKDLIQSKRITQLSKDACLKELRCRSSVWHRPSYCADK